MNFRERATFEGADLLALVHDLIERGLFDPDEFVIAGSARLWIERCVRQPSDLDIVAIGRTWDNVWDMAMDGRATIALAPLNNAKVVHLHGAKLEVSNTWLSPCADPYRLIEEAEWIDGLRYPPIRAVIDYKQRLARPKDVADLAVLRSHRPELFADHRGGVGV